MKENISHIASDVLIIGSGIGGLSCAIELAKKNINVCVITKKNKAEANTNYAQGGIAAVLDPTDSFINHINDTLIAGDGLCDKQVVEFVVKNAPKQIDKLIDIGVQFTKKVDNKNFDLGKEGGHSKRRILHSGDLTGKEIEQALLKYCEQFSNLVIYENYIGIDLIKTKEDRIIGCYAFNQSTNTIIKIFAKKTVIATGGVGKVYLITSNPDIATGDGIAMAYRTGVSVSNLEFTQFHPTCLFRPEVKASTFLLSEALRGEGARLLNTKNERFMSKYDSRLELAPRDIVARAIDSEIKQTGEEYVFLDITDKSEQFLKNRFPGIFEKLLSYGYNLAKDKIPVVPAAHYLCGGILTDLVGKTNIDNLYCVGEAASTGLHGANRLASNSLLEAAVFGNETAKDIMNTINNEPDIEINNEIMPTIWNHSSLSEKSYREEDRVLISHNWHELRLTMWNYVGIVRSEQRLKRALKRIHIIKEEVQNYLQKYELSADLIELWNLVIISEIIVKFALERQESRGIHYRIDFPEKSASPQILIFTNENFTRKKIDN
ncbi:MAG: L-aspartate oxidase [Candidatus Thorarchaeota archaeon]